MEAKQLEVRNLDTGETGNIMESKYEPSYGALDSKPMAPGGLYDESELKGAAEVRILGGGRDTLSNVNKEGTPTKRGGGYTNPEIHNYNDTEPFFRAQAPYPVRR